MRATKKRWGEVTIKKQGGKKNSFDQTKSFSIENSQHEYDIEQLRDIYVTITDLTEKYKYIELKKLLVEINK